MQLSLFWVAWWEVKTTFFEALVVEREATVGPGQEFGTVPTSGDEDKKCTAVDVEPGLSDKGLKSVKTLPHVARLSEEVDFDA